MGDGLKKHNELEEWLFLFFGKWQGYGLNKKRGLSQPLNIMFL
jgi:hypothetical protein